MSSSEPMYQVARANLQPKDLELFQVRPFVKSNQKKRVKYHPAITTLKHPGETKVRHQAHGPEQKIDSWRHRVEIDSIYRTDYHTWTGVRGERLYLGELMVMNITLALYTHIHTMHSKHKKKLYKYCELLYLLSNLATTSSMTHCFV